VGQLAEGPSLKYFQGYWDERSCPRSAAVIHSVALDRTPNFPTERGTLYHWATTTPVFQKFFVFLWAENGSKVFKSYKSEKFLTGFISVW